MRIKRVFPSGTGKVKRALIAAITLFASCVQADSDQTQPVIKDLFFGNALYYAFQNDYFEAITRLDTELGQFYLVDEPELDPFHYHVDQAEISVGELELSYRMHQRAGRALTNVIEGNVSEAVRNEAAYRLAQIYFNKNQPVNAFHAIERIKGELPESLKIKEPYLSAQIDIATGRFTDAIELLEKLKNEDSLKGFASYNLGIAYIQNGEEDKGVAELKAVGAMSVDSDDDALLALKDKANLTLGYRLLENGSPQLAQQLLGKVRLDGPFSNRALLGAGWINVSLGRFDRALVPWTILQKRNVTNESVQEALLAVPYAYGKLNVYGRAAIMYGKAMDEFGNEIDRLDKSIKSIREGKFVKAILSRESDFHEDWLVKLRQLPDAPETWYLLDLLASHDFQEGLQNYFDLAELGRKVAAWLKSIDTYEEIIEIRRQYYQPLLPVVEAEFKKIDSRMRLRLEQRDRLDQRLQGLLVSRRPEYLATADERDASDTLDKLTLALEASPDKADRDRLYRVKRLKGVLEWRLETEYDERLTEAYKHLHLLDEHIEKLNRIYQSFIRTRQAATQSYEGYTIPLKQLRTRLQQTQIKLNGIMARQGRMLETMAINRLDTRRKRLEDYQVKARFAMAESYDRATSRQQKELEQKEIQEHQEQQQEQQQQQQQEEQGQQ